MWVIIDLWCPAWNSLMEQCGQGRSCPRLTLALAQIPLFFLPIFAQISNFYPFFPQFSFSYLFLHNFPISLSLPKSRTLPPIFFTYTHYRPWLTWSSPLSQGLAKPLGSLFNRWTLNNWTIYSCSIERLDQISEKQRARWPELDG